MATIALDRIDKTYPGGAATLRGLDLAIGHGELLVLVGPSGCGKSTALRIIAGLEAPTGGRVRIGEKDVTDLPPQARAIAMVFQSYALYPHMSVRENLAFGLRMRRVARSEIARRVEAVARSLGLEALLERRPAQLSGGQRQRVALGRAIVREPAAFLLDEPLSNLDAKLRAETRAEIARLHRRLGATMVHVTHDQEEAMTLGDRIAVLRDGRLEQVAPPLEVHRRPSTAFVGTFVGSPTMNLLRATLHREPRGARLASPALARPIELARVEGDAPEVQLGVRPQDVQLVPLERAHARGRVDVLEVLGSSVLAHVDLPSHAGFRVVVDPDTRLSVGDEVGLALSAERVHVFDAASGARREAA